MGRYDRYEIAGLGLCYPIVHISTNNPYEVRLRKTLPTIKGAKRLYHKERADYIDDPYGRPYRVGTRVEEIWDMRGCRAEWSDLKLWECLTYEEQIICRICNPNDADMVKRIEMQDIYEKYLNHEASYEDYLKKVDEINGIYEEKMKVKS